MEDICNVNVIQMTAVFIKRAVCSAMPIEE